VAVLDRSAVAYELQCHVRNLGDQSGIRGTADVTPRCLEHDEKNQFTRKEVFNKMRKRFFAVVGATCMLAISLPLGMNAVAMEDTAVGKGVQADPEKKVERARKAEQKGRHVREKAQKALTTSKKKIEHGAKKITETGKEVIEIGKGVTKETGKKVVGSGKKVLEPVKKIMKKGADKLKGLGKKPAPVDKGAAPPGN
jgi:hypothetical protein